MLQPNNFGLQGATLNFSIEGVECDGETHCVGIFDLSEKPL
jgi:hypothetical protein